MDGRWEWIGVVIEDAQATSQDTLILILLVEERVRWCLGSTEQALRQNGLASPSVQKETSDPTVKLFTDCFAISKQPRLTSLPS